MSEKSNGLRDSNFIKKHEITLDFQNPYRIRIVDDEDDDDDGAEVFTKLPLQP